MQVYDGQQLQAKFEGRMVKVDPYFQRRSALVINQTLLKLGEYNLTVVPALLGFDEAQLLAALTSSEVALFSRYTNSISTLVLVFDNAETKSTARFHIRVHLVSITPVPDRKNICWLQVKLNSIPADLVQILGSYWEEQELRHEAYEKQAFQEIVLDDREASLLGYNNYAELIGERRWKVGLKSFHSKLAVLVLPEGDKPPVEKEGLHLKLYFKSGAISISGTLAKGGLFSLDFSNEFLTVLEDYRFRKTLLARRAGSEGAS